jgi:hypothetical protein
MATIIDLCIYQTIAMEATDNCLELCFIDFIVLFLSSLPIFLATEI